MKSSGLMLVVAVSGACVLAIEILGTRILGPFYGVSLFLWSALISVTLAALSAGYVLGGRYADRGPSATRLSTIVAAAGLWMLLVPWMRAPLLGLADGWGLRTAVLVVSFVLFFPPLTLLGMVSPYAIRLRAQRVEEVGRTAGSVFAVSTLASVVAAIATGFWLIPNMGVMRLTLAIGVALLLAAIVARVSAPSRRVPGIAALLAALLAGSSAAAWSPDEPSSETRFLGQSAYAEIEVVDHKDARHFLIDGGVHTAVFIDGLKPIQEYVVVSELAGECFDRPGDLLLIGLGGGAAARTYARAGWRVDAVEIDPLVTRVAREYFGLQESDAQVVHMDGRRFLGEPGKNYDIILLDAFGSSSIPFHLTTTEVFALMKSRLRPGGVVVVNTECVGWHHPLIRALASTLRESFAEVLALPIAEPPNTLGNLVLVASDRVLEISDEQLGNPLDVLSDRYEHWRVLERNHAWDNRFEPEPGLVITDDLNPVDLWSEEINRVARRELREYFAPNASAE